mmetsp:Transcript_13562/g.12279  ORF Transcript_13562/g.12279 Transcript_13562/m.12279 type:complete len:727 (-) Transcript_13562:463-2643(-)
MSNSINSSLISNNRNVLLKEGILPANPNSLRYKSPKPGKYKARDQDKTIESKPMPINYNLSNSYVNIWNQLFLQKSEWISLSCGWYQATSSSSGQTTKCGLHSVIESFGNRLYMIIYEPQTTEVMTACSYIPPAFDLEVSIKIMPMNKVAISSFPIMNSSCQIIFSWKSVSDYMALTCDIINQRWYISNISNGQEYIIAESNDDNIKANLFVKILVQVRDTSLSIDINSLPVFTAIRLSDGSSYNGLLGLQAKMSKFAMKGWKIKGIQSASILPAPSLTLTPDRLSNSPGRSTRASTPTANRRPSSNIKSLASLLTKYQAEETQSTPPNTVFERIGSSTVPWGNNGPGIARKTITSISRMNTAVDSSLSSDITSNISSDSNISNHLINNDIYNNQNEKIEYMKSQLTNRHDKNIIDSVTRDIIQHDLGVTYNDIAALDTAKRLLNEAIVLPLVIPEFFTGIREPWKGVLLFGPPGTGKTLLAKAICSLSSSTFFNCSSASLISKYRGDSEKIIRCLFDSARICAPSIVFIDEIDAIVSNRGIDSEHEASRRMKTELFTQMDGITSSYHNNNKSSTDDSKVVGPGVMVLATTNCPWDLDDALRRRLEKRIYISLPDMSARIDLFNICLSKISMKSNDIDPISLASLTDGYSGADIYILCREASMMPLRRLMTDMSPQDIIKLRSQGNFTIPQVLLDDFLVAISTTKPSVATNTIDRYIMWEKEYGSQ